jgi:F-type H+-transporting ATPase subunit delta
MKTIKQLRREARRLFRLCLVDGSLDEERVRRVVRGVLDLNRRGSRHLLSQFLRFVKLERSLHIAEVESAAELTADVKASVLSGLEQAYGPGIRISFAENAALIGGMRIRVASDIYDGSVKAGLAALETRL